MGVRPHRSVRPLAGLQGFERFYGFIGGETNQWTPGPHSTVSPPSSRRNDPDYHLMPDLADKAIDYIRQQKSLTPDKPFFIYFAPGATHAPHHVPKEWIAKYKGHSTTAGMRSARRPSRGRRSSA